MATLHDFQVKDIAGNDRTLADYKGKVCLVVNVASECGLTPQYDGLQRLHTRLHDQGLEILGFPCNQFGAQEPGSDAEIQEFCTTNFGVSFPMFSKVEVNGEGRDPLYAWLTEAQVGPDAAGDIAWNFAKFVIGRDGSVVARFAPPVEPGAREVIQSIEGALAE